MYLKFDLDGDNNATFYTTHSNVNLQVMYWHRTRRKKNDYATGATMQRNEILINTYWEFRCSHTIHVVLLGSRYL